MPNIFELNVNINATGQTEAEKAMDETTNGSLKGVQSDKNDTSGGAKAVAGAMALMAVQEVKQTVMQIASYQTSKLGTAYGDTARANQINNIMSTASGIMSSIGSIGSYTLAGLQVGGPYGAIAGAIIGTVVEVTEGVISIVQNQEMYDLQQRDHMLNSNYKQERLGLLATSKGR